MRRQLVGLDDLKQSGRLLERCDTQLLLQDAHAFFILVERRRPLAGPGVQTHEMAVCGLVQGIKGEPATRVLDRQPQLSLGIVADCEPFESGGKLAAQTLGLKELPVVEFGAVAQGEARQEITALERHSLG